MALTSVNVPNLEITTLPYLHGGYYFISGLWPLIHMQSFMVITGPKMELWLVKTVGILILIIGMSLLVAAYQRLITLPVKIIAISTCLGLIFIDIFYTVSQVISPVYLIDAGIEFALLITWIKYTFDQNMEIT